MTKRGRNSSNLNVKTFLGPWTFKGWKRAEHTIQTQLSTGRFLWTRKTTQRADVKARKAKSRATENQKQEAEPGLNKYFKYFLPLE